MKFFDRFLNTITMYRLVLYALGIFTALAFIFSVIGTIAYSFISLAVSLVLLLVLSYVAERLCAALWKRDRNPESALITALILFLILAPPVSVVDALWLSLGAVAAIVSKYLFSYNHKHLFNPAAVGAWVLTLAGAGITSWWVASPAFFPAILMLGLMIVRKLRRFDLWLSFIVVALVVKYGVSIVTGVPSDSLLAWFVSWPTLFLSTIMLTEPLTMPATARSRMVYGGITGALFSLPISIVGIFLTPQLALLLGNLYTFVVSPKGRVRLTLVGREQLSHSIVEFSFTSNRPLTYTAGQYAEWTLPHKKADDRGVRRYFTFASAPGETIRLAIRISDQLSTFKKRLMTMPVGSTLSTSNVAGDFVLPENQKQKLLFVAGGVGITPFISMIRALVERGEKRDIVLVYLATTAEDFAYHAELDAARALGVRTLMIPSTADTKRHGLTGPFTPEILSTYIPDYATRLAYIWGPDGMVSHYKHLLGSLLPRGHIKTDYFPGL